MRAWTLGYPPAYEVAVRIPGNAKAPGGYCFRTKEEAQAYSDTRPAASSFRPYEIELPVEYEQAITRDARLAAVALHEWHQEPPDGVPYNAYCAVCTGSDLRVLDCDVLVVSAPFVIPE